MIAVGLRRIIQLLSPATASQGVLDGLNRSIDITIPKDKDEGHRRDPYAKVLYCTGHKDLFFQARPVLGKTEALVEKPVTVTEFRDAVSQLLFGHTGGPAVSTSPGPSRQA